MLLDDPVEVRQVTKFGKYRVEKMRYRVAAIRLLGGCCAVCGFRESMMALEIDHILGDGNVEDAVMAKPQMYMIVYKALFYNIPEAIVIVRERYQVLCCNHNKIKQHTLREYGDVLEMLKNTACIPRVRELRDIVDNYEARIIENGGFNVLH